MIDAYAQFVPSAEATKALARRSTLPLSVRSVADSASASGASATAAPSTVVGSTIRRAGSIRTVPEETGDEAGDDDADDAPLPAEAAGVPVAGGGSDPERPEGKGVADAPGEQAATSRGMAETSNIAAALTSQPPDRELSDGLRPVPARTVTRSSAPDRRRDAQKPTRRTGAGSLRGPRRNRTDPTQSGRRLRGGLPRSPDDALPARDCRR